jgi:hypothetical protein
VPKHHWPRLLFLYENTLCFFFVSGVLCSQANGQDQTTSEELFVHPYQDSFETTPSSKGLHLGASEILDHAKSLLHSKLNRSDITIDTVGQGMNLTDQASSSVTLQFSKDGIPVCLNQVKAIYIGGGLSFFGDIPKLDALPDELSSSPDASLSLSKALLELEKSMPLIHASLLQKNLCLFPTEHTLKPVWNMIVSNDGYKYQIWGDEESVYKLSRLFFESGVSQIQAYPRDSISDKSLTTFTESVSDTTLSNTYFVTDPSTSVSGIKRASSVSNEFIFPPEDPLFDEASIFVHANQHYAFFRTLGYEWSGASPIILKFHTLIGNTKNNALYQPADDTDPQPIIMVGDGDGVILRNLPSDSDVVSHEFGHHIIFRNIKETSGESLILHEGIADYFVFARNKDPCLGRSICVPGGHSPCVVQDQCLRIASKTLQYDSNDYNKLDAHFKGQLASGFLYELNDIYDENTTPTLVFKALNLLTSASGFKHLIIAMMLTDYQVNQGVNACKIYDAAIARGFAPILSDVNCTKLSSIKLVSPNTTTAAAPPKSKKKNFLGCSGSSKDIASARFDLGLLFLLLPLVLRRRKK